MGTDLVNFVYATMRKRANHYANPHSLPKLLEGIRLDGDKKLLPVQADDWHIGALTGEPGEAMAQAAAGQWWALVENYSEDAKPPIHLEDFHAIPHPERRMPDFTVPHVEVSGLDNAQIAPLANLKALPDGYRITFPLQFGRFTELQKVITLKGRYVLRQSVCAADKGKNEVTKARTTMPDLHWPVEHIQGHGNFALTVNHLTAEVDLHVQLLEEAEGRELRVVVEQIRVPSTGAPTPSYSLAEQSLTIDGLQNEDLANLWRRSVISAFAMPEAHEELTRQLVGALSTADALREMTRAGTEQLHRVLDITLRPVPAGGLSREMPAGKDNPVDVYLFDRLKASLNDPESDLYPPKVLLSLHDPRVEPYTMQEITIPQLELAEGMKAHDVKFLDIEVRGPSNAVIPAKRSSLVAGRIQAAVELSTLEGCATVVAGQRVPIPDPPLSMSGRFHIRLGDAPDSPEGRFTLTVKRSALDVEVSFRGEELELLEVVFDRLGVRADLDGLRVEVLFGENDQVVQAMINEVLNSSGVKKKIIEGVNGAVDADRPRIGEAITGMMRAIITERLDTGRGAPNGLLAQRP